MDRDEKRPQGCPWGDFFRSESERASLVFVPPFSLLVLIHSTIVELFNIDLLKISRGQANETRKEQMLPRNNSCRRRTINCLGRPVPAQVDSGLKIIRLGIWNHRIQNALAKEAGLPVYELECVLVLYLDRPSSASSLAQLLGVRSSSLSKLLRRLEERGLVERTIDRSDRRVERITLAAAGVSLAERAMARAAEIAATMLELLPEARRPQFLDCIRLITSSKIPEVSQTHPVQNEPSE